MPHVKCTQEEYLCNNWVNGGRLTKGENSNMSFAMLECQGEKLFL